ncbi:transposase [Escherichia coli]|uniref:transposase n=1 Tax=Escherichia coli TaxID=562 RepID=UPI0035BE5903
MEFYPSCIEKGMRSERALKLAIAEMYVKGVSTRRVSDIVEILCGTEVSSSQGQQAGKGAR